MRVRCVANDIEKLNNSIVRKRLVESIHREGADEDLTVNAVYAVLAMEQWSDGGIRVYLHTVGESNYPYPYPVEMFEVVDATVTTSWCVTFFEQQSLGMSIKRISFPEWAHDDFFYERLVDGDEAVIAIYKQHRERVEI